MPGSGRELVEEFSAALAGWPWDVALLQEVPPWWPQTLAARIGERSEACVQARLVLTSRNSLLALRRALAVRWPDLIKSNGGGANAILARSLDIVEHRTLRLCLWPERRWLHAARLATGLWVGNLHATVHDDVAARRDADRAGRRALAWAAGSSLVLGGDFNVRSLQLEGLADAGCHDVDHVFVAGLAAVGSAQVLGRHVVAGDHQAALSDHAPVLVELERTGH